MTRDIDIAIIGAGAAGIGAARQVAAAGLSHVLLEALPRPGGRAWTRQAAGVALDMGCGYLHSADRNPWTRIAEAAGVPIDRSDPAWGVQSRDLGFPAADQARASAAFDRWTARIHATPPASDCAADLLDPADAEWTPYLQALSGYISGDELERISVRDYAAYDAVATDLNWRLPGGYGALIAASLPAGSDLRLATPVTALRLEGPGVTLETSAGTLSARAAIVTVSSNVIAGDAIRWPAQLDPWREAAARLPLGNDEKLYFEIVGDAAPFEDETHVLGDPRDATTGSFYIRPQGKPVVECFLGGAGARRAADEGQAAAFERATAQLAGLFGAGVRRHLRPLVASDWTRTAAIGGGYSHALPGQAAARQALARPCDGRVFFAGEATHETDFSTAHGALLSGQRAADEAVTALRPR